MKKIVLIGIIILSLAGSCFAQSAANRTWKTKVSDALGLMPAPNEAEYTRLMGDLVSTGAEGVDMLVSMFDGTNNVPVSYALAGWSAFVSQPGQEDARKVFAEGIVRGLEKSNDREIKAFYVRLLQQCGKEESVDALAALIDTPDLFAPALTSLVSNGTEQSKAAIAKAITQRNGAPNASQVDLYATLAQAAGDALITTEGVEDALISWLGTDAKIDKAIYHSLSKIGSEKALPILAEAADKAEYKNEPTHAADAYLALIKKLQADGMDKIAVSEANKALKKAVAYESGYSRIAATEILVPAQKDPVSYALKAMKDPDRIYRNSVLQFVTPYMNDEAYAKLGSAISKTKCDLAKIDIINYLGTQKAESALSSIVPYFQNENTELATAAMWAATRIGETDVPTALADVILSATDTEADQAKADVAAQCLQAYNGNINDIAASIVEQTNDLRGITLLANRRATDKADVVFEALKKAEASSNMNTAPVIYNALASVVDAKDLSRLYTLLEAQTEANKTEAVQQAIVVALSSLTPEQQAEAIAKQMNASSKKSLYYVVMAEANLPQALATITEGFDNGSVTDKTNAFKALLRLQGMDAANKLAEIAAGNSKEYASKALMTYIDRINASSETAENKILLLSDALDIAANNSTLSQKEAIQATVHALNAVGNNKTFQGLILAGRYLDHADNSVCQAASTAVINTALAHKEYYGPAVVELVQKASDKLEGRDSSYIKEQVRSHLASLPQTGGFVSMFNGKDLTGWKGLVENPIVRAKMKPEELAKAQVAADERMRADWVVNNGLLEFVGNGFDNICTEKQYGDFEMYVDWKLYAEGTEADAGIYLRGTPQVQMWDTARRNVGAQVGSGGLYNNQINPSTPSHVADNPLGTWNTFYIKMVGDRVTVLLNGEKVVDNVILENYWDRSQPIFPIEQIELQAHGTRVAYRNLYINELEQVKPTELSAEEQAEGFKLLYDGTNMHNWIGNTKDYVSQDGAIVLYPGNGGGGNLYTKDEYKDFVFRFDFMLTEGANNGVGIRTPTEGDAAYVGMEIQVLDNEAPIYSQLEVYQYHGSVYGVIPAKRGFLKPVGEWNSEEIWIKGNDIRVTLNGEVITEGNIAEASKNGTLDHKDHPGLKNEKGHIGFLGHGSVVKFKNIRIKEL